MPGAYQKAVNRTWNYDRIRDNLSGRYSGRSDRDRAAIIAGTIDILIGNELKDMEKKIAETDQRVVNQLRSVEKEIRLLRLAVLGKHRRKQKIRRGVQFFSDHYMIRTKPNISEKRK